MHRNFVMTIKRCSKFFADQSDAAYDFRIGGFPRGKRARVYNASTFKESSPISLPVCVKRLKDVALNKLQVRAAGATRGAVEERVANNFRTVVYLRSFSTSEKETAQHRTSIFLFSPAFSLPSVL